MRIAFPRLLSKTITVVAIAVILPAAAAERPAWRDDPLGDRFWLGLGIFSASLDTQARRDSSSGVLGTVIDFETTLGMDDHEVLPSVLGYYRIAKKHRISFQYFSLERSGSSVTEFPIRFGDTVFPSDLPISSYFDVDVYSVAYSYSLIHNEKMELALGAGLQFQDIDMGIAGTLRPGLINADASLLAPLPTFGGSFDYAISDKWIFRSVVGVFGVSIDLSDESDFRGDIYQVNAGVAYKASKHVGLSLQYSYFRTDINVVDPEFTGALKYRYSGPVLAAVFYF